MKEACEGMRRKRQVAMGYPDDNVVANHVKSVREDETNFVRYVGFQPIELSLRSRLQGSFTSTSSFLSIEKIPT